LPTKRKKDGGLLPIQQLSQIGSKLPCARAKFFSAFGALIHMRVRAFCPTRLLPAANERIHMRKKNDGGSDLKRSSKTTLGSIANWIEQ